MRRKRLGEILVSLGALTPEALQAALDRQRQQPAPLGVLLRSQGQVEEEALFRALALQQGWRWIPPRDLHPDPHVPGQIPATLAWRFRILPLRRTGRRLQVVLDRIDDFEPLRILECHTGLLPDPGLTLPAALEQALLRVYGPPDAGTQGSAGARDAATPQNTLPLVREVSEHPRQAAQDPEAIRLVDRILREALLARASDVHLDPSPEGLRVRFRLDGLLQTRIRLADRAWAGVISRLKVLAHLDIAERRLPQDGAFRIRWQGREVDIRISTLPTVYGEKVVLRILDPARLLIPLEALGFPEDALRAVERMLQTRWGLFLVVGPTGSGKTTTLYALLREIQQEALHILTVEDPVEYHLEGINQVSVRPEIGLDFPRVLRTLLRQDPDVIMVGEIRDPETASMALRAALTGHLVLSTLHTQDAPSAVSRLLDLGIPSYLLASTLVGVIAQRLVRRRCTACATSPGAPCAVCGGCGYWGRVGIFECLMLDAEARDALARGAGESWLRRWHRQRGGTTLLADAQGKVRSGITTWDEVARVLELPDPDAVREDEIQGC